MEFRRVLFRSTSALPLQPQRFPCGSVKASGLWPMRPARITRCSWAASFCCWLAVVRVPSTASSRRRPTGFLSVDEVQYRRRRATRRSALRVVVRFAAIAFQSELLHSIDQCLAAEVEVLGCVGLVPVEPLERPNDQFLLDRLQADAVGRKVQMKLIHSRAFPPQEIGEVVQRDFVTRSEERRVGKECRSRWSAYH